MNTPQLQPPIGSCHNSRQNKQTNFTHIYVQCLEQRYFLAPHVNTNRVISRKSPKNLLFKIFTAVRQTEGL